MSWRRGALAYEMEVRGGDAPPVATTAMPFTIGASGLTGRERPHGYSGTRIVGRSPEGGVDPEADLVANEDFWKKLADSERMPFQMHISQVVGNTVWMLAPSVPYTNLTYRESAPTTRASSSRLATPTTSSCSSSSEPAGTG